MGNFKDIQDKLQKFISKYYTNELIKGLILFVAFGLLYFLITLLIEYYLWLSTTGRMILFFIFLAVELGLLIKFICIPLAKLLGLRSGLSQQEASKIIGNHFSEVDDRLLNVLQLNESSEKSELLVASIEQKAANLRPIPFKRAINFSTNAKYIKYLAIPVVIWLFSALTGNQALFNESLDRVVHYKTAYEPPAPFSFTVDNENLTMVEGASFELIISTVGEVIPENVTIHFDEQEYLMKEELRGQFSFSFSNLTEELGFYVSANGVTSMPYTIQVINTPKITNFEMNLDYPNYTGKRDERLQNTGNTVVPEGTVVTWNIRTKSTDTVHFVSQIKTALQEKSADLFSFSQQIRRAMKYQIATSNEHLKEYEKLDFSIQVIRDEFPKIEVKSDIDSVQRGPIQFAGQLNDDYGLTKLQLVFYNVDDEESKLYTPIDVNNSTFQEFYHVFSPETDPRIKKGMAYEMYFEVFDNDGVNGAKSVKSKTFSYYQKTKEEIEEELLKEQKDNIDALTKTGEKTEKLSKEFEEFSKKLKNKPDLNWNDKKQFEQFMKRQEQYQEMLEEHTDKLKQTLDDQEETLNDPSLQQKKEQLKKRIEEAQELQEKDRLLKELRKMAEKMEKEDMIQKLDKLTERNKQEKRTLERMLEMSKRFFVEKKAGQISRKLDTLAAEQEQLSDKKDEENTPQEQEELNDKFEKVNEDFEELKKQNTQLAQPMNFPDSKTDREVIKEAMTQAKEKLEEQEAEEEGEQDNQPASNDRKASKKQARTTQKAASKKMKELSNKMSGAVQAMQGETITEDIATLRGILENLLSFSFDQEQLMLALDGTDAGDAEYPKHLKKQQLLKEHFEHIDDSIYALALRQDQLSSTVQTDLTEAHYNINRSLANIADNRIQQGQSNQQYTMTAANNIAELLSNLLNSLQNPSMGEGQGQGKGQGQGQGGGFQLQDIIKKQGEMKGKMQEGNKGDQQGKEGKEGEDGNAEGQNGRGGEQGDGDEDRNGQLYEIYQEQNRLRQELQQLLEQEGVEGDTKNQGKAALRSMEKLEQQLLDKGFTNEVIQQMQQMEHELLKLDDALKEQGKDNKRQATSNTKQFQERVIPPIRGEKLFFNVDEILNRESLPLRTNYKKKVQQYFKKSEE